MTLRAATMIALAPILAVTAVLGVGVAQQRTEQVVTPPNQVYWMSVTTQSGLAGMAGGGMGAMMGGGGGASNARMLLQLGSKDAPTRGAPQAAHTVPAGARVGPQLDLKTPQRPGRVDGEPPQGVERPRGRLLLFFGCGERAKAGQPVVFDFARMAAGEMPRGLESRIRSARTPAFNATAWRTYGEWPNVSEDINPLDMGAMMRGSQTLLPAGATLAGAHVVRGNYTPDIRFSLSGDADVMAPVTFTRNVKAPSGAVNLAWTAVPTATAYSAFAIGQGKTNENEMVFWTSSEVANFDQNTDFLPPSEAARLVRERVLMAPATTSCTVPAEVLAAMRPQQGNASGMLIFTAFGPEQNILYPTRPADPRTPWNQQWFVKARFSSSSMQMLGQDMAAMMAGGRGGQNSGREIPADQRSPVAGMTITEYCQMKEQERASQNQNIGSAIGGATGIPGADILGGMLGGMGQKKAAPPADPNCPPRR